MGKKRAATAGGDTETRMELAEGIVGHRFGDRELLRCAITHPSAVESKDPSLYYERLEYLGDSVLGFLVAEEVFRRFPLMPEGGLTRIKISVVAGTVLSGVAAAVGLSDALVLGESEKGTGSRGLGSALENTYEALVAALYLDGGIDAARRWVLSTLGPLISEDAAFTPENPKSALQELVQARGAVVSYRVLAAEGPPHDRVFTSAVDIDGVEMGSGSGRSKKEAEAAAAQTALETLQT